jgi:hypothetical protein
MRLKFLAPVLASLALAASAQAGRFEWGPRFAVTAPTGSAGHSMDLGFNAGVRANFMFRATSGLGVDLGYHYWPGSSYAKSALDDFLSTFSGIPITGSDLNLSAIEATAHVKEVLPVSGPVAPWIQLGAGVYRMHGKFDAPLDRLEAAGSAISARPPQSMGTKRSALDSAGAEPDQVDPRRGP